MVPQLSELKEREQRLLKMIAVEGRTNDDIAELFKLTNNTAERLVKKLAKKLGVSGRIGLAHYYVQSGGNTRAFSKKAEVWNRLNQRSKCIATRAAAGDTNMQIAKRLSLTEAIVKNSIHDLYLALKIKSRYQLPALLSYLFVRQQRDHRECGCLD